MKKDLISIILPVHNGEKHLSYAIESILEQTYSNFELIIVDDHSQDRTLNIARGFQELDSRIRIIENSTNLKLPASLNVGHKAARGKFLTWTSDDNIYQKDALEILQKTLINKEIDVVYADYLIINDEGVLNDKVVLRPIEFLLFYGVIGACFLYKKKVFWENGGYRENLIYVEDFDFWLRAQIKFKFYKIENPGYYFYRRHTKSLTYQINDNSERKKEFLKKKKEVYVNFLNTIGIKNQESFTEFLLRRYEVGPHSTILPVTTPGFFKDLDAIAQKSCNFSSSNLKYHILADCVEAILKNKEYQNLSVFIQLHKGARTELLKLSIRRYLAVVKKCLF